MPKAISAYTIVAFEGNLYLFGGWDGDQYVNSVYKYSPDEDSWEERTPMPTLRGHSSAAVAGGKIYIIGGTNGDEYVDVNEIYQPDLDTGLTVPWSEGEPLPFGRANSSNKSTACDGAVTGIPSAGIAINAQINISIHLFILTPS